MKLTSVAETELEMLRKRADIADELARAAFQVIENYGFTSDGNDRYREVETGHIKDLEAALARYRALTP